MPTKRKSDGEAYFTDAAGSTNSQRAAASGLRDVTSWSKMMLTPLLVVLVVLFCAGKRLLCSALNGMPH